MKMVLTRQLYKAIIWLVLLLTYCASNGFYKQNSYRFNVASKDLYDFKEKLSTLLYTMSIIYTTHTVYICRNEPAELM